jgi:hypothetical protein
MLLGTDLGEMKRCRVVGSAMCRNPAAAQPSLLLYSPPLLYLLDCGTGTKAWAILLTRFVLETPQLMMGGPRMEDGWTKYLVTLF